MIIAWVSSIVSQFVGCPEIVLSVLNLLGVLKLLKVGWSGVLKLVLKLIERVVGLYVNNMMTNGIDINVSLSIVAK